MNPDILSMAQAIYGEAASEDFNTMHMIGSTMLNRLKSGRAKEFGANIPEILNKGYYAVSNPNEPYKQALSKKFPDKQSELKFKQALQIASGLYKGTIKPTEGEFYFTPKEIANQKKAKSFNFKVVKDVGSIGKYKVFSY